MNGDAHAPGTGSSQPLPPAFPERLPRGLESAEQALHPPFFPGERAAAEPEWSDPAGYDVALPEAAAEYAAEPYEAEAAAADELLPTPEDFGYLTQPPADEPAVGEIPAEAFLDTAPLPAYDEPAFEAPPLPTYEEAPWAAQPAEEPASAAPPLPTYDEPVYDEPAYVEPAYAEPALVEAAATQAAGTEAELAERLEALARDLRTRGTEAIQAAFAGDPLDAALAGLISGYMAGRGR